MTSLDEIRQLFFVECEEQLEELTDGLDALDTAVTNGERDVETINTMFRAVHSIKGGAASFSLDAITRFAHVFESVLDEVRNGTLDLDRERLRAFYLASDYLSDLVAQGAAGEEPAADELEEQLAAVTAIAAGPVSAPPKLEDDDEPEEEEGPDCSSEFEPVVLSFDDDFSTDEPAAEGGQVVVSFSPKPELYTNGHEPVQLFREISSLGEVEVAAELVEEPNEQDPSISWTLTLPGDVSEADIHEILEFAEPFAEVSITTETSSPAPEQEQEAPIDEPEDATNDTMTPEPAKAPEPPQATPEPEAKSAPESAKPEAAEKKSAAKATVRVDLNLVDDLINKVGELVITQSVMSQSIIKMDRSAESALGNTLEEFRGLTRQIQEGIMAIRAQSVKPLFQRMGRIVRETAQIAGKDVRFATEGEDTEIDRTVTERLVDPLTHILRNAVDHGLEHADKRKEVGKDAVGTVTLSAAHRSGRVLIEIRDDGGGVNREKVLASAISKGLVPENASLSPAEIDRLLFMPGFSTANEVTKLSGRGVGMDVVNNEIKRLGGRVSISSTTGEGTTISISLPLTLAVLDGMIVDVAGQTLVVPIAAIGETIRPEPEQLHMVGRTAQMVTVRDVVIPVTDLGQMFKYSDTSALERGGVLVLVEGDQGQQRALAVDRIHDQRQVVIKSLETNYGQVPFVAAATILGDGQIALIVDIDEIMVHHSSPPTPQALEGRRA